MNTEPTVEAARRPFVEGVPIGMDPDGSPPRFADRTDALEFMVGRLLESSRILGHALHTVMRAPLMQGPGGITDEFAALLADYNATLDELSEVYGRMAPLAVRRVATGAEDGPNGSPGDDTTPEAPADGR